MSFTVYPALDIRDGRVVRLLQGDYAKQTTYGNDALPRAQVFANTGARWMHLVDLDAAKAGGYTLAPLLQQIAATTGLKVQTGGGVRGREDVARILEAGASRVVIGSLAVRQPEQVLEWLALPPTQRPHFITLYFDKVDTMGHLHGPDAAQLNTALAEVDTAIGALLDGIRAQQLQDSTNIVVVSDHGMTATDPSRQIYLDDLVDVSKLDFGWTGAYASFNALPGGEAAARQLLAGSHPHIQCMTREQIPARFEYGQHRRVPAYICTAELGWQVTTRQAELRKGHELRGEHGYDNRLPDMYSPFIGYGPAFAQGVSIAPIDNVDIYPLLARLLHITPARNDGNPGHTDAALKH